jgi:hypothetical protein
MVKFERMFHLYCLIVIYFNSIIYFWQIWLLTLLARNDPRHSVCSIYCPKARYSACGEVILDFQFVL